MRSSRGVAVATAAALFGAAALGAGGNGEAPKKAGAELKTASGTVMVYIPAGEFVMGSADGPADTRPAHKVSVSAFYLDKYEVTQESYLDLIGVNPSKAQGERNPVEQLRWSQAAAYCNARSAKEGLKPCYNPKTWACDFSANGYRLPTEAEWEYACRAGATTAYSFGDDAEGLASAAWFRGNARGTTHPVGRKAANAWGLHDMLGNVMEWCNDFYGADYYKTSPTQDPKGPATGKERVLRGGGYRSAAEDCRCFTRAHDVPDYTDICTGYPDYGFRCVRKAE